MPTTLVHRFWLNYIVLMSGQFHLSMPLWDNNILNYNAYFLLSAQQSMIN